MTFFAWLLRNRLLVLGLALAVAIFGALAWARLPVDAFPDVTNTQVMILTEAPGLAADDVEQRVSAPIELAMRGLPRVTNVRSLSRAELSQVVVIFEDGADTWWTRQLVFERLAGARDSLPPGVEPELGPVSTGLGEIFQYTLEGEGVSPMELRSLQQWIVAPILQTAPGVTEVNSFGGELRQVQVVLDPERLLRHDLSSGDVVQALAAANANAGAGVLTQGWEQRYLRGVGQLGGIEDVGRVVVQARDGTPLLVRDLGEVVEGPAPRQGAVTRDGQGESIAGMVIMLKDENAKDVVAAVREAAHRAQDALPEGVELDVFYDRTDLVQACVHTVLRALSEGGIFVVLVLFLFVAEVRTALLVLVSLPLTFLATFVVMGQAGMSANLMSLGGLAFSVGMVVDASIVVVENVRRHLAERDLAVPRAQVVAEAAAEVARPVAFSVLIIALILVPLYTLQGIEGKMFAPLATTMLVALLCSLGVALLLAPVLADLGLPRAQERRFGFVRRFHAGYLRLLDKAVRHPKRTVAVSLAALLCAAVAAPFVGTEFMPPLDEGAIAINVVRLPNASLAGSVRVADYLEERLLRFPEVATVVSKTGRAEISEDPMGPEQTDVMIMLKPRSEWDTGRDKAELTAAIAADLGQVPGLRLSFSQPISLRVNELISGVKGDLAVKVFGPDLDQLKAIADEVAGVVGQVEGASDVKVEQVSGMEQAEFRLDRAALARHGITVDAVNEALTTAVGGTVATTLVEGQRRTDIAVRFPEERRSDLEDVGRLLVLAPSGARIPLAQLGTLGVVEAPAQITREQGMRRVVVETNVRGRDLGGLVSEVQAALEPLEARLPPGYFIDYGGQFENQRRAMAQLALVLPIALGLIVLLLHLALGSFGRSLLVLLNLPFALVGGILAVVAFGMPLSVSAAVAFIVLLGIAVQNGVVLVAFLRQLEERGLGVAEAVHTGCDLRFRPLLMTALTSFIGHLPMLYATGSGADIQRPLAVVVMGGLVTSTLLTLFVLPAVYVWVGRGRTGA